MFSLAFVFETLMQYETSGLEPIVTSVVIDSRLVRPGSLFIAFEGDQLDGHTFVSDAFNRGAVAALVQKPLPGEFLSLDLRQPVESQEIVLDSQKPICLIVPSTLAALQSLGKAWRQKFPGLRVIGITGSVGKTTTKELTHAVLSRRYKTLKSEGNYNNEIGLPLTLLTLLPEHEMAVLEMGMYTSGEIALLCDLAQPQVGVVTIIGAVHMEWLGSIEAISAAKQELVESLPGAPDGVAILNMDDPLVMAMSGSTQARVVTYGLDSNADLWADNIVSMGLEGIHFTLHYEKEKLNLQVPLLGRHSVHTALRATAVGLVEGLNWDEIISGLHGLSAQLRLVAVPGPNGSIILDDTYNSSPESALAALNLLADLEGRRIAVLGDMLELGPVEAASHRLVGRRARDVADVLVTVGPLGELIAAEALIVGMPAEQIFIAGDSLEAVAILEDIIEPADIILVKGSRGVHMDQIVSSMGES
jgi:UDP-N-acetylmuramoyl-tripeptide--D-alanyl-D-alanine ligase